MNQPPMSIRTAPFERGMKRAQGAVRRFTRSLGSIRSSNSFSPPRPVRSQAVGSFLRLEGSGVPRGRRGCFRCHNPAGLVSPLAGGCSVMESRPSDRSITKQWRDASPSLADGRGGGFRRGMAQLAARWAHNPQVTGSNPVPAISIHTAGA